MCAGRMDDFTCPVCHEARFPFRVYACGHSVCTECMRQTDDADGHRNVGFPHHRCPLCRAETLEPWQRRPWNRALNAHLLIEEPPPSTDKDVAGEEGGSDLCANATLSRIALCEGILPILLLDLRKAADAGEALVVFRDTHLVESVSKIRTIIVEKLFRHGVHRVELRNDECLVSLIPEHPRESCKCVFVNPDFVPSV